MVFDILIHFSLYLQVVDINIYTHCNLRPALDYFLPHKVNLENCVKYLRKGTEDLCLKSFSEES